MSISQPASPTTRFLVGMRGYMRQTAGQLTLGSIAGILTNSMVILPAVLLGRAIDKVLAWQAGKTDATSVKWAIGAYVGGVLLTEGPRVGKRWWLRTANICIRSNIRADAMRGVLAWPMERLHGVSVGDLMARIIGDVEVVGRGVREITIEAWDTVLLSISLITTMILYNARLTGWAIIPIPFAMLLAHATGRWVKIRTTASREANSALTAELQERLAGVRVLRLFGRASAAVERIRFLADRQAQTNLSVVRLQSGLAPVYNTMMMAGVILVVWLGGLDVIAGTMTVGSFVAFLELFLRFANRGARIPRLLNSVQSAGAAYARLEPLLAPPLPASACPKWSSFKPNFIAGEDHVPFRTVTKSSGPVSLELQDVVFRYPGAAEPALKGVSFNIPPGSLVAITGPVGSGKSAIARAVLGLFPLESGSILWDRKPLTDVPSGERSARTGYLPQEAGLFSGSIRENILMGLPEGGSAGQAMVQQSVECSALNEDIAGFPSGLETQIGETGVRLSGGQRQRVALARALSASLPGFPGLLVLDDPFSAVDVETEIQIIRGLRERHGANAPLEKRATTILLSHRLAAFPLADLIVVVSNGTVEESGTHHELLQAGGLYSRIFQAQGKAGPVRPEGARSRSDRGWRRPEEGDSLTKARQRDSELGEDRPRPPSGGRVRHTNGEGSS